MDPWAGAVEGDDGHNILDAFRARRADACHAGGFQLEDAQSFLRRACQRFLVVVGIVSIEKPGTVFLISFSASRITVGLQAEKIHLQESQFLSVVITYTVVMESSFGKGKRHIFADGIFVITPAAWVLESLSMSLSAMAVSMTRRIPRPRRTFPSGAGRLQRVLQRDVQDVRISRASSFSSANVSRWPLKRCARRSCFQRIEGDNLPMVFAVFSLDMSMTSPRRSQKSISMSGMLTRSGFKTFKYSPYLTDQLCDIKTIGRDAPGCRTPARPNRNPLPLGI